MITICLVNVMAIGYMRMGKRQTAAGDFLISGDVLKEIANEVLPESHRNMVEDMQEMTDTKIIYKGYTDFVEEMEGTRD